MSTTSSTSLDQVSVNEDHAFVTLVTPRDSNQRPDVTALFEANRQFFMDKITKRGVVLFRGFGPIDTENFNALIAKGMGLKPWNGFNLKGMPAFVTNWLRSYTEALMGSGDYRRYLDRNTVQLGPVGHSVQGPHVEGGGSPTRARHLALCCFEPAKHLAETGLVDLVECYARLPESLKRKYLKAYNRFYFITARPLNWFDRLVLSQSPVKIFEEMPDGRAKLATKPTPAVCAHPETGEISLQPWAFARNTNTQVHAAAQAVFTGRGQIGRCENADGTNYIWDLCDEQGKDIEWTDEDKYNFFEDVFKHAFLVNWQKDDIALVDNVRMGHWRMNGEQGNRRLMQIQVESFNAEEHKVPASGANRGVGGMKPAMG
jgi:Taurine catabolism dioxygenase TauD, TfdA family